MYKNIEIYTEMIHTCICIYMYICITLTARPAKVYNVLLRNRIKPGIEKIKTVFGEIDTQFYRLRISAGSSKDYGQKILRQHFYS